MAALIGTGIGNDGGMIGRAISATDLSAEHPLAIERAEAALEKPEVAYGTLLRRVVEVVLESSERAD